MGMEFYFEYDADDKSIFEVAEAGAGYWALIECKEELLKEWGLWKSFVKEYRDERQTYQEWLETTTPEERAEALSGGPPDDEEMEELEELSSWGPSQPFNPNEAKDWAAKWILILDLMSDEDAKSVFPIVDDLHCRETPFGRDYQIRELREVIDQAECATRHRVKMRMQMIMG